MLSRTKNGFLSHFGGSKQHEVQYKDKEVLYMKKSYLKGDTYKVIGMRWGVSAGSIQKLIYRRFPLTEEEKMLRKENNKNERVCL